MTRKSNVEQPLNIAELLIKRKVEDRHSMVKGITDCQSLGEIKQLVDSLLGDYGPESKVNFDSGHNNISEEIITFREESSAEVNARIDKEIEKLIAKELSIKKQSSAVATEIQSLMKLKNKQ
jgi:hypothetical protein